MSGQERYEYRPDDDGRAPYGGDAPGRAADGRRRATAEQTGPDEADPNGYDPLGIRRSPADLPGVADPPRGGGDPRGADPYGGYGRDGYPDQPRPGRGYQQDPYDAPAGYDRDPYAHGRDDRPAPDERADRGRDPYGREWGGAQERGGYPPARDNRGPAGYPDPDRDDRGPAGYPDPDRDPYGRGRDDRSDRGGYPAPRDDRGPAGYPDPVLEGDTYRRDRRGGAEYGYGADPLGVDPSAPPMPGDRAAQGRGGDPRHTTDPRQARHGGDPRLSDPRLVDPRLSDPRMADPRLADPDLAGDPRQGGGSRGGHSDPRGPVLDDPRAGSGWDRERPSGVGTVWEAVVEAEREYYDSGDDHRVPFPTFYPRRVFALAGAQMLVGRRSESRGIHPDIDLSGAPEDPGISRSHALFELLPDGGYAVRDPGSTNGTRLNDEPDPIEPGHPVPLRDGDRVYLGAWTRITLRAR